MDFVIKDKNFRVDEAHQTGDTALEIPTTSGGLSKVDLDLADPVVRRSTMTAEEVLEIHPDSGVRGLGSAREVLNQYLGLKGADKQEILGEGKYYLVRWNSPTEEEPLGIKLPKPDGRELAYISNYSVIDSSTEEIGVGMALGYPGSADKELLIKIFDR